jgi:HAD superfamily phosphatase (TIGR01668 family)
MLRIFYPNECADSAYVIDYKTLYEQGYKGLLFDIDNTLVEHGADADERAVKLITDLRDIGFRICFISNNHEERVKRFNKDIKAKYIYDANKPLKKSYFKALKLMGTKPSNTVFVGDQLFTDVWGAKRAGLKSFFVKPIGAEKEIQIVIKRYLERVVLYFYRKEKRSHKI